MTFSQCLLAAAIAYDYQDSDKAMIRQMALDDREGLETALHADPLLPWVAYANGITNERPKGNA